MAVKDEFEFPDEKEAKAVAVGAGKDDDFEIEVLDDTPAQDKGRRPLDKEVTDPDEAELESYSEKVQGRIKELTHARHDERRAKETIEREKAELERAAKQLLDENRQLRAVVDNGSKQYVEQALTIADSAVEKAKRKLFEAQEAFDNEAIVAAQEELFDAKIRAAEAKKFRPTSLQEQEEVVQTQQQVPNTPRPDTKTLRWQAKNQWFGDPEYDEITSFAMGLHNKLVRSGVDPTSDGYFEQIDARLKTTFPEMFGGNVERQQSQSTSKRPASVVAPAARSSGARKIQLTATQVALASKLGLTPQQYAVQVAKLEN